MSKAFENVEKTTPAKDEAQTVVSNRLFNETVGHGQANTANDVKETAYKFEQLANADFINPGGENATPIVSELNSLHDRVAAIQGRDQQSAYLVAINNQIKLDQKNDTSLPEFEVDFANKVSLSQNYPVDVLAIRGESGEESIWGLQNFEVPSPITTSHHGGFVWIHHESEGESSAPLGGGGMGNPGG